MPPPASAMVTAKQGCWGSAASPPTHAPLDHLTAPEATSQATRVGQGLPEAATSVGDLGRKAREWKGEPRLRGGALRVVTSALVWGSHRVMESPAAAASREPSWLKAAASRGSPGRQGLLSDEPVAHADMLEEWRKGQQ